MVRILKRRKPLRIQVSGATRFFIEVGRMVGRKLQSGPAIASVATSGLLGMVTGSVVANITITGSFTIPLMKSKQNMIN